MNLDDYLTASAAILTAALAVMVGFLTSGRNKKAHEAEEHFHASYEELTKLANQRRAQLATEESTDTDQAEENDRERLAHLSSRVDGLEERLPSGAILDKLASVNDAILATRLDELARRIDRLETDAMTPGKVATVVFAIMAVYLALAAVLPWVLQQAAGN